MDKTHKITMLGTGLIGMFYTMTLHGQRGRDRVQMVYSRTEERAKDFAAEWDIPRWTTDLAEAINDSETDVVVIGLPNDLHLEAVAMAAEAGKAVLCTKPLGRNAAEAKRMLDVVENAGVFHGYLEDLVYPRRRLNRLNLSKTVRLGRFYGFVLVKPIPDLTATGSGILSRQVAVLSLTWDATASKLSVTLSAKMLDPLRLCVGRIPSFTLLRRKITGLL